jgi:2-polyprenyl-3-methyl-5-hydroxy-6-metoxy-1,4-benzoquinol methylase
MRIIYIICDWSYFMSDDMKGVKDFYNKTANEWAKEWYSNETMLPLLKKFRELFDIKPRILDAGCGAGYESMRLACLGAEVVGIDISEESINIARIKNPKCHFELIVVNI